MNPVPFHLLFVSTNDACRAPVAALAARGVQPDATLLEVRSAGTAAVTGGLIDQPTAAALAQRGIDHSTHRADVLDAAAVAAADLVLAAAREHRDAVLALDPGAAVRTFTIAEFARLVDPAPALSPVTVVAAAATRRATEPQAEVTITADDLWPERSGASEHPDDIPDPYRRSWSLADQITARVIADVVASVTALGLTTAAVRRRPRPGPRRPRPA